MSAKSKDLRLRVTAVRIRSILGLQSLDLSPGRVTVARGKNGSGKTSILKALEIGFQGAGKRFPSAVNLQSEDGSGEVQIELQDVDLRRSISVTRTLDRDRGGDPRERLDVRDGKEEVRKPQAFLDALLGPLSWSPIRFAAAPPREQRQMLLDAMRLTVTPTDILPGLPEGTVLPEVDWTRPALDVVQAIHGIMYARRHAVNQRQTQLRKTEAELTGQIPADYAPPDPAERSGLMEELSETQRQAATRDRLAAALAADERKLVQAQAADQGHTARILALTAEIAVAPAVDLAPLQAREAELARALAEVRCQIEQGRATNSRRQRAEAELETVRVAQLAGAGALKAAQGWATKRRVDLAAAPEVGAEVERIRARLATLDQMSEVDAIAAERERVRRDLETVTAEWDVLERTVVALAGPIPRQILARADLGIEGLAIDGDAITVRGVPMSGLCGAERIRLALEIAKRLSRACPVICLDAAESLSSESFEAVVKWFHANDIQGFVTMVADGPLAVTTDQDAGAAVSALAV